MTPAQAAAERVEAFLTAWQPWVDTLGEQVVTWPAELAITDLRALVVAAWGEASIKTVAAWGTEAAS